jgi:uncharacterized protein YkwD
VPCSRLRSAPAPAAAAAAAVLGLLAAALPAAPAAAAPDAPAVVTARLLAADPAGAEGEGAFLIEIVDVRHGGVPGSVLAVRLADGDARGRRLAEAALASGEALELVLVEGADGGWEAAAVRAVGSDEVADPTPPPLAVRPPESPQGGAAAVPRILAPQSTPGAPFTHQVVELVNHARLENGDLPPLGAVASLDSAAQTHSTNMAVRDFFAHCDVDTKTTHGDRMTAAGYLWNAAGENIAAGQATPQAVMETWLASPGHRTNILSTVYREIGVGHHYQSNDQPTVRFDQNGDCSADASGGGPFYRYWTQNFGRRNSVYPVVVEREAWRTACSRVDLYTYGAGWAQEMRFSNDGAAWSPWVPFMPDVEWFLDPSDSGSATVFSQLRNGATVRQASDTIMLNAGYPAPPTVTIYGQILTGTATYSACEVLRAGQGTVVATGADVTFEAPTIVLENGFTVADGASFTAGTP